MNKMEWEEKRDRKTTTDSTTADDIEIMICRDEKRDNDDIAIIE